MLIPNRPFINIWKIFYPPLSLRTLLVSKTLWWFIWAMCLVSLLSDFSVFWTWVCHFSNQSLLTLSNLLTYSLILNRKGVAIRRGSAKFVNFNKRRGGRYKKQGALRCMYFKRKSFLNRLTEDFPLTRCYEYYYLLLTKLGKRISFRAKKSSRCKKVRKIYSNSFKAKKLIKRGVAIRMSWHANFIKINI